jgi:hypothetical protein
MSHSPFGLWFVITLLLEFREEKITGKNSEGIGAGEIGVPGVFWREEGHG